MLLDMKKISMCPFGHACHRLAIFSTSPIPSAVLLFIYRPVTVPSPSPCFAWNSICQYPYWIMASRTKSHTLQISTNIYSLGNRYLVKSHTEEPLLSKEQILTCTMEMANSDKKNGGKVVKKFFFWKKFRYSSILVYNLNYLRYR